jgi:hypothetical protein
MHKTIWASMFAAAALTLGSEARAQANLHTADVLHPGDNMFYGEVGWPDFTAGWQHGLTNMVDIGVKLSIIYGFEYRDYVLANTAGMGVRVPIRITPVKTGKVSFQIRFEPGLKFDSFGSSCGVVLPGVVATCNNALPLAFGLWLPLGLDVGIHITREATVSIGMEAPFFVNFTNGVYGGVPLLFGPAFEYDLDQHIGFGVNAKFGPSITSASVDLGNGFTRQVTDTEFGFLVQGFFAYRL